MAPTSPIPVAARLLGVVGLFAVALLTWLALTPPEVVGADSSPAEFSADRAVAAMADVVRGPHPTGSPENDATRERLVARLAGLGLQVLEHEAPACTSLVGSVRCSRTRDVAARLAGRRPGGAVALFAHYDSVPNAPGAGDDGSGIATLLETARALVAGSPLSNDVLFVFTDAEELGLIGAEGFAADHPWRDEVRVALNFEARGSGGVSTMFDASPGNGILVRALAATATRPVSNSLASALARALPNDTDGSVLKAHGGAVLNFAFIDGFSDYHRATDDVEHLDRRSVQHHGSYALALARYLGEADLARVRAPDLVWFDVGGRWLVAYPPWLGAVATLVATILYAAALLRGRRTGAVTGSGVLAAAGLAVASVLLVGLASAALSFILGQAARWSVLVSHGSVVFVPHVFLAAAVGTGVLTRGARRRSPLELGAGALLPWLVAGIATAGWAPAAGFLFHVPALFAALGLLALARGRPGVLLASLSLAPAAVLLAELTFTLLLMTGAASPVVPALAASWLVVLSWGPLALALRGAERLRVPAFLLVGSLASGAAAFVVARGDQTQPRLDGLRYALDADSGRASFLSLDRAPDAFTRPLLGERPRREALPSVDPFDAELLVAPAPSLDLTPPELTMEHDELRDGRRALTLRVRSTRDAACLRVWEPSGADVRTRRVDGRAALVLSHFSAEADRKLWTLVGGSLPAFWTIDLCGGGKEGHLVEVDADPAASLVFHVVDRSYGLPPSLVPAPREPGVLPSQWSDVTLVARGFPL